MPFLIRFVIMIVNLLNFVFDRIENIIEIEMEKRSMRH